jgi:hypothetical protein
VAQESSAAIPTSEESNAARQTERAIREATAQTVIVSGGVAIAATGIQSGTRSIIQQQRADRAACLEAEKLNEIARYVGTVIGGVHGLVKRYPAQMLAAGAAAGFVFTRLLRSTD